MTLKVIGAGFGRTGTLSMKAALEQLGYDKTHHMEEVMKSPKQTKLWHQVGQGDHVPWDQIFEGFQASVDFPSSVFYGQLLERYPNAKVVLTVRDVDRWYESTSNTIFALAETMPSWLLRIPHARQSNEMVRSIVWDGLFQGRFADETFAKQVFTDHIAQVKATVPANQLLVFQVSEGWGPLCAFLGKAVPTEPFPNKNDTTSFQRKTAGLRLLGRLSRTNS